MYMIRGFFLILISLALASCATAVMFNVEHPPLVDLRDVNSITVIPEVEYEYDEAGNVIVQRYTHNGILERLVLTEGNNETEELYMNGILVLRAYWENGRKIREERMRR